mgnify:CR=1 FL=1
MILPCDCKSMFCAVVDGCLTQVLLVSAADRDQAAALLAEAPDDMP